MVAAMTIGERFMVVPPWFGWSLHSA